MSIVYVPFYPSDWLAGTRGLSDAETGVYITLIARMYELAGPIERDDNRLSRLCGCKSKSGFVRALEYLISEGKIVEVEGAIFNKRVEKEIKNVTEKSAKAQAAAQSRWDRKSNKNNEGTNANASVEHMPQLCQPKPKPKMEKVDTNVSTQKKPPDRFEEFWNIYPHRNGAKKGKAKCRDKFARHVKAGVSQQSIIDGAIRYAKDRQVIDGFAKNPETWLNNRGWDDDIEPAVRAVPAGHSSPNPELDLIAKAARMRRSPGALGY